MLNCHTSKWATSAMNFLTSPAEPLSPTQKFVLVVVMQYANTNGEAWPGVNRISRDTGFKERAIRNALNDLCSMGLLTLVERGCRGEGHGRGRRANVYRVNLPAELRPSTNRHHVPIGQRLTGTKGTTNRHLTHDLPAPRAAQVTIEDKKEVTTTREAGGGELIEGKEKTSLQTDPDVVRFAERWKIPAQEVVPFLINTAVGAGVSAADVKDTLDRYGFAFADRVCQYVMCDWKPDVRAATGAWRRTVEIMEARQKTGDYGKDDRLTRQDEQLRKLAEKQEGELERTCGDGWRVGPMELPYLCESLTAESKARFAAFWEDLVRMPPEDVALLSLEYPVIPKRKEGQDAEAYKRHVESYVEDHADTVARSLV